MKFSLTIVGASIFFSFPCAAQGNNPRLESAYLTPLQLNQYSAIHDGEEVLVMGWINVGIELRQFWNSEAARRENTERLPRACITLAVDEAMWPRVEEKNRQAVLIRGIFFQNLMEQQFVLGGCHRTGVRVLEIIELE